MAKFKMTFYGEDVRTTIKSERINEPKLDWFLKQIDMLSDIGTIKNRIRIYRGSVKIKDISLSRDEFLMIFSKWLDYKKEIAV